MKCTLCGREITLTQIKAGEYRRVEIETAACEPLYNMPVHVSCGERVLKMIFRKQEPTNEQRRAETWD